ncbi:adenylosuccinate synthetase [Actinoplanes derwentensis]|uniref:Adenylosuccinate synthetase n=1 Tax=Actinoplanes derwentensis TaxID=113562 RepID=A0A1H2D907_9ACTN|nr:adenylosuccinate synthetase [Actinoplanes derwentensis]GID86387.1 adenylosuccinate synthetase [Actinoplanes derwentensis]SDT79079.1 adenylosuccinate synthase [Actinoplanes derwentensis]
MTGHVAVVDLGYGDAGKGTVVDALCAAEPRRAVLRFNGGAQAAHNVITEDGRHHTFAQFGSGTLRGVPTHLTRFMVVDPLALAGEAAALGNPFHLLTVDGDALLATPWHRRANHRREIGRGDSRHGSCGMGVGETMSYALSHADAPRVSDVLSPARLRRRFAALRDFYDDPEVPLDDVVEAFTAFGETVRIVGSEFTSRLLCEGPCVFEGAQGVLLDEWRGWHPYTTWSTTTFDNVQEICPAFSRLGVVRTYTTRHGAGPFVTEDPSLDLPERHNGRDRWQGAFRTGHFDAVAHRYAIEVAGGVDALAITHLDVPERCPELRICTSYDIGKRIDPGPFRDLDHQERLGAELAAARPAETFRPDDWCDAISTELGAPVYLESYGPTSADKKLRPG